MIAHLVVAVSAHGFGHIGQTAPVVRALGKRVPGLKITVRSAAPRFKILERFGSDVQPQSVNLDIGILQKSALEIAVAETAQAYQALHDGWQEKLQAEAKALEALDPDLLLVNIPYLTLAAARLAGIPAVALGSLNWADIYGYYYRGKRREADSILDAMLTAYNAALRFLQPAPRMPMEGLTNALAIGPVAQLGTARRSEINETAGVAPEDRLVMISLGGMDYRLLVEDWRDRAGLHFVVPDAWNVHCRGVTPLEELGMPFADVMASSDALIAKPSYASFVEATCLGIPVLYLERPNWPEVPYLLGWLEQHNRCAPLLSDAINRAGVGQLLEDLWSRPTPKAVVPTGVDEATDYLAGLLV